MLPAFAKLTLAASQTLKGLFLRIGFPRTPFQESCMGFSLAWYMIIFPHETILLIFLALASTPILRRPAKSRAGFLWESARGPFFF